jgi:phosphoglycolate phosphatase-like HAD superfamily hydrolase
MLIFWDIDGTLMTCGGEGTKALNQAFSDLYGINDAFTGVGIGSAMDSVIIHRIIKAHNLSDNDRDLIESQYLKILKKRLSEYPDKRVLPGVIDLLDYIDGADGWYSLLLTSNLRKAAEVKLESVGLSGYFTFNEENGFGDRHGEKWDALSDAIKKASARTERRIQSREVCVIGDSVYDIRSARRLGVGYIAVATGWASWDMLEAEHQENKTPPSSRQSQCTHSRTPFVLPLDTLSETSSKAPSNAPSTATLCAGTVIEVLTNSLSNSDLIISCLRSVENGESLPL